MPTPPQGQDVKYELHSIGWKAFQDLCLTILSEVLGQTVEKFLDVNDGGRDGAFNGRWKGSPSGIENGAYTVQCKHTSIANNKITLSALEDDFKKAKRLAARGLATNYILLTNFGVSGVKREKIEKRLSEIEGVTWSGIYDSTWITARIRENPKLRMHVPRIYGLGDLSQILDERAYDQATAILETMGEDLGKFVVTDAYHKAAEAVIDHGFVILLGEPASGKTMIASTLTMGAIDNWNCNAIKIIGPDDFKEHWNPNEPKQLFWMDDAFGVTQYQRELVNKWNIVFPHLASAVKKGAKVIFTSRDYIFRAALNDLKTISFPLLEESKVVINVQDLKLEEKQQIIYNHIKMGDQALDFKTKIKPFLERVSRSERFLPEIARRLGNRLFITNWEIEEETINKFVEEPLEYLMEVLRNLDEDCRAAIGLLFIHGGAIGSPIEMEESDLKYIGKIGSSEGLVIQALNEMKGSLVKHMGGSICEWEYKHPTIGDAYRKLLADNPELIDVYLEGVTPDALVTEIVCGDVKIQGVLTIPESRYPRVAEIIGGLKKKDAFYNFLAHRCDKGFLKYYLDEHPDLAGRSLGFGSFMQWAPEVGFVIKLNNYSLLNDEIREVFIENIMELAVETPDAEFLTSSRIRGVLTENEIRGIMNHVEQELVSQLRDIIYNWKDNYDSDEDPEMYFDPLIDALDAYKKEFDERDIKEKLEEAIGEVRQIIDEIDDRRYGDDVASGDYSGKKIVQDKSDETERSIFDDIDE
jgi:Novel STAND NTPase 3